jgi:uncharacterized membrane protein YraQ (UPF0718 family)
MKTILFPLIINGIVVSIWLAIFLKDKRKGMQAMQTGVMNILEMTPFLLIIVGFIGLFSVSVSPTILETYLGGNSGIGGFIFVSLISSLMQIPGIMAVPIASTLRESGVPISITTVFLSASTMSSVFTLPLEIKYLGKKFAYFRIFCTYLLCIIVSLLLGYLIHLTGGGV